MATVRQRLVAKEVLEKGGSVSAAMRKARYSPKTIKNPQKLTKSKGWEELTAKYMGDERLAKLHDEMFNAANLRSMDLPDDFTNVDIINAMNACHFKVVKIIRRMREHKNGDDEHWAEVWYIEPDRHTRKEGLSLGLKATGKLTTKKNPDSPEGKPAQITNITINSPHAAKPGNQSN